MDSNFQYAEAVKLVVAFFSCAGWRHPSPPTRVLIVAPLVVAPLGARDGCRRRRHGPWLWIFASAILPRYRVILAVGRLQRPLHAASGGSEEERIHAPIAA
jgi:hypothetical protein